MPIRYQFQSDEGFRFYRDELSLLLHAAVRFKQSAIVTNIDLFHLFEQLNKFLQFVGAYDREKIEARNLISAEHFVDLQEPTFYKFLPDSSAKYVKDDSFQFGSIRYYRDIEQQQSKDSLEGLANIAFKTPKHLVCMSLASGYNFAIFCGTATLDRRNEMGKKFGPNIIRIRKLKDFAEAVRVQIGAKRFYFNQVIYDDLKLFRHPTLKSIPLNRPGAPNDNFDPSLIDERIFDLLYDASFLPSLFMKPTRFSGEQELRLVFELDRDVRDPIRITKKGLLKYVDFIE